MFVALPLLNWLHFLLTALLFPSSLQLSYLGITRRKCTVFGSITGRPGEEAGARDATNCTNRFKIGWLLAKLQSEILHCN